MKPSLSLTCGPGPTPAPINTRPPPPASPPPHLPIQQIASPAPDLGEHEADSPQDQARAPRRRGMAELVPLDRSGGWRKRIHREEEVAVAVMGAQVPRPRGQFALNNGNQNHLSTSSKVLSDQDVIDILKKSGKVSLKELCSYLTPQALLNQNDEVDPIVDAIRDIINSMAKTRRLLLLNKLRKRNNSTEDKVLQKQLDMWPVQVQQMHGQIEALRGRCLRIPENLVEDISLQE